jgi:oligoribonuclease NrnB/cAMP/cGMP phosphodiesterase (DHH superfamily)
MKIFHHDDMDGQCSAAIVLMKHPDAETVSYNYKNPFPINEVKENDEVFIVDMRADWPALLERTSNVVWIDHHSSSIKESGPQNELPGLRLIGNEAAALLTWRYITGNPRVPEAVELISDFDTWTFARNPKTLQLMYGLKAYDCEDPKNKIWSDLLDENSMVLNKVINDGEVIKIAYDKENAEYLKMYGFETELEGHDVIAVNKGMQGSLIFGDLQDKYDITSTFVYDAPNDTWMISLYTKNPDIDVSVIAKKLDYRGKGGGHRGAAGMQCKKLPFET